MQSRYNAKMSVVENIKLPPTLLSRFDLIYLILDKPNEQSDRKLAQHLVSLYYDDSSHSDDSNSANGGKSSSSNNNIPLSEQPVDQKFLRDYILYARNNMCPEISDEAETELVTNYVNMRSLGGRSMKTITATPRQLESLIRLSQALAKMRLSEIVTQQDVVEATRLMKVATQTAATDPRTGTIDMDMITTGKTSLDRDLVLKLTDELRRYFSSSREHRTTLGKIRQDLLHNMAGGGDTATGSNGYRDYGSNGNNSGMIDVRIEEIADAVKELEAEGLVQLIERSQHVIIRGK